MSMRYKKWVKQFLVATLSVISLFALFNYSIDPLWTFCHSNKYNNAQVGFDERQLKSNRAYFCGLEKYDTLLLGSSRTTYINQHDFSTMNVFNYSSVSMYPKEYIGWIEEAKKIKGSPFKTIIFGVDFSASNNGAFGQQQINSIPIASHYTNISKSFMYRYKMLFTMDTFYRSLEAIEHSKNLGTTDYTRGNVKQTIHISDARKQQALNHQIPLYSSWVYGKQYKFNTKIRGYFESIKKNNPNTNFIIFTTPTTSQLFNMLVDGGNLADYEKWLGMMVDVFGEVYNFMGVNTITNNPKNYADLHHFYPPIGKLIANRVSRVENSEIPKDFGILVNKNNFKEHIKNIKLQVKKSK